MLHTHLSCCNSQTLSAFHQPPGVSQNEVHSSPAFDSPSTFTKVQIHPRCRKLESARLGPGMPRGHSSRATLMLGKENSRMTGTPVCLTACLTMPPKLEFNVLQLVLGIRGSAFTPWPKPATCLVPDTRSRPSPHLPLEDGSKWLLTGASASFPLLLSTFLFWTLSDTRQPKELHRDPL